MTIKNNNEKWVALICVLERELEYYRDAAQGGYSGIGPDHDGEFLTICKYCNKPLLWKI